MNNAAPTPDTLLALEAKTLSQLNLLWNDIQQAKNLNRP
jgi:hypothetical protein